MLKLLQIKSENSRELAILTQRTKYHVYTIYLGIPINALDNINSKGLILFEGSFIGLEGRMDKIKKGSNPFPFLDLGI